MKVNELISGVVLLFILSAIALFFSYLEESRKNYVPPKDTTNYKLDVFIVDGKELQCISLGDSRKLSCNWENWNQQP